MLSISKALFSQHFRLHWGGCQCEVNICSECFVLMTQQMLATTDQLFSTEKQSPIYLFWTAEEHQGMQKNHISSTTWEVQDRSLNPDPGVALNPSKKPIFNAAFLREHLTALPVYTAHYHAILLYIIREQLQFLSSVSG